MTQFKFERALVVDDDPDVVVQASRVLSGSGAREVVECLNAESAVHQIESEREFQLALIDLRMPKIGGAALIQMMRTHRRESVRMMSIIVMCGVVAKEEVALLGELGLTDTISKPLVDEHLQKKIMEVIAIRSDPSSEKSISQAFAQALAKKDFKRGEELLAPKLKQDPNSPRYLTNFAELLFLKGESAKAEQALARALKIDPNYLPGLNLAAKIYVKTGRYQEAMNILLKARAMSPQNIERLLILGEMYLGSGESAEAETAFQNAVDISPIDARAQFGLGRALAVQGKVDESKQVFSRLQKSAELAVFFNTKGILLVHAGRYDEGVSLYQNAMKVLDDRSKQHLLLYNIALAYSKAGNFAKAKEFAQKSQHCAPASYKKPGTLLLKIQEVLRDPEAMAAALSAGAQESAGGEAKAVAPGATAQEGAGQAGGTENASFLLTPDQVNFITGGMETEIAAGQVTQDPAQEMESEIV